MDFNRAAKRGKPGGEPVEGHALHAATQNFGECRLVGAATARGLFLGEVEFADGFPIAAMSMLFAVSSAAWAGVKPISSNTFPPLL